MDVYLQGADGEEWELKTRTPDPVEEGVFDRTAFFPKEALEALTKHPQEDGYYWIRIVEDRRPMEGED